MPQAFSEFLDVNLGNLYVFPNIFPNLAHSGSETGSHSTASATTQSDANRRFLVPDK
jgi:hypothetical protein